MIDVEKIKETVQRGISILKDKGIPESVEWIGENGVGFSDEVTVDNTKDEDDFPNCWEMFRFEYRDDFYEMFFHRGPNTFTLMINGKTVLLTGASASVNKMYLKDESFIKILKLGRWIDDLPGVVQKEQDALRKKTEDKNKEIERGMERHRYEREQAWATEISKNLDLGDYE